MKRYFIDLFHSAILLSDSKPSISDKALYILQIILASGPIIFILDGFGMWFETNRAFCQSAMIVLLINLCVGAWFHYKRDSFKWEGFFWGNLKMMTLVTLSYVVLEQLRKSAGDNSATEAFKYVVQVATLLWPVSKTMKNVYLLSDGQHPPAFVMERLYKFNKTGKVSDILGEDNPHGQNINHDYDAEQIPDDPDAERD